MDQLKYFNVLDEIPTFIPKNSETRYVILGTMASACARNIKGVTEKGPFFYQSTRNNFWRILAYIFEEDYSSLKEVQERRDFLERHGIAVTNLVGLVKLKEEDIDNPDDLLLFDAHEDVKQKRIEFKKLNDDFKDLLMLKPVFFTCLEKPRLRELINSYFEYNNISQPQIQFLPSPTRCSSEERGERWKKLGLIK